MYVYACIHVLINKSTSVCAIQPISSIHRCDVQRGAIMVPGRFQRANLLFFPLLISACYRFSDSEMKELWEEFLRGAFTYELKNSILFKDFPKRIYCEKYALSLLDIIKTINRYTFEHNGRFSKRISD